MVSDRAFIFHISSLGVKHISSVPKSRSSIKFKVKYQGYSILKKWPGGCISDSQTQIVSRFKKKKKKKT